MSSNRPTHDSATGGRIRYSDSPSHDADGNPISYQIDRSDPAQHDQTTGLPCNLTVDVSTNAPVGSHAPTARSQGFAEVTKVSTSAFDGNPPILSVAAGTTVSAARRQYASQYSLESGMAAHVNGREVGDHKALRANDRLTFRYQMKERG